MGPDIARIAVHGIELRTLSSRSSGPGYASGGAAVAAPVAAGQSPSGLRLLAIDCRAASRSAWVSFGASFRASVLSCITIPFDFHLFLDNPPQLILTIDRGIVIPVCRRCFTRHNGLFLHITERWDYDHPADCFGCGVGFVPANVRQWDFPTRQVMIVVRCKDHR